MTLQQERNQIAEQLIEMHKDEDGLQLVRLLETPDESERRVALLEVNRNAVSTGTVMPVSFPASGTITLTTTVLEVTPDVYESIEQGKIQLPAGWKLGKELFKR